MARATPGRVVGWTRITLISRRAVYAGVAEVSVYVGAGFRGLGLGRAGPYDRSGQHQLRFWIDLG